MALTTVKEVKRSTKEQKRARMGKIGED